MSRLGLFIRYYLCRGISRYFIRINYFYIKRMNTLKKFTALGILVTILGICVFPHSSADYGVSPSFTANSTMSVAQANQICMSLPDSVASQESFCSWSSVANVPGIADNAILITVTSPTTVTITWNTVVPTTTTFSYISDPLNPNIATQYSNTSDGYTTFHTIMLSGLDLTARHLFIVSGSVQGSGAQISSAEQWL